MIKKILNNYEKLLKYHYKTCMYILKTFSYKKFHALRIIFYTLIENETRTVTDATKVSL